MQHSIAAKLAARPAARFVTPSTRTRERRMGLRASHSFVAAPSRRTVLRRPAIGLLAELHAPWRAIQAATPRPARSGRVGPRDVMHWTRSMRASRGRRASAAPAWRD